MRFIPICLLILGAILCPPAIAEECLDYEPRVVTITGELVQAGFAGPAKHRKRNSKEKLEEYYILKPIEPVCVAAANDGDFWKTGKNDIETIQLILKGTQYKKYRPLLRHKVKVTGTLIPQMTSQHHTPVLLNVSKMKFQK